MELLRHRTGARAQPHPDHGAPPVGPAVHPGEPDDHVVVVRQRARCRIDDVADGIDRHEGGYDLYRKLRDEREAAAAEVQRTEQTERTERERRRGSEGLAGSVTSVASTRRRLSWKEERELEGLEQSITEAEAERDRLAEALGNPALYVDGAATVRARADYDASLARVDELYARWAELEAKKEAT